MTTETHPLAPFLPANARILMLGSFPPKRERWSMDFYYPNMQNDMWRIFGLIFFGAKDHFLAADKKTFDKTRISRFLEEKGIALSDTAHSVVRLQDNASDKFLEVVEKVNLEKLLNEIPRCEAIVTTGQKATDTLLTMVSALEPKVGNCSEFTYLNRNMKLYRMPSSSRAYPKPIEEKAKLYQAMFQDLNML